ncbi:hypothetical protein [Amycolatopsis thermoflava]|uniref:hypothetical protein n=1 Tax=Amycolatopsis thermoflava TaxID=84480 RepID=UPI003D7157C2
MSTFVLFTHENRLLDLAKLNERDYTLISSMHGQISRGDRVLLCQQAPGDGEGAEMFVKRRNDRYFAAHFPGSRCAEVHAIERESDEHRRQKDYWQRAAEDAGYRVSQEYRTGAGTVLDVAIEGPRPTGVEVQHSALPTRQAKARTTRSFRAGWLPVWFLDSDHTPPWFHKVPTLGCNEMPWSSMPPRRSATALGASKFVAEVCNLHNFGGVCPAGTPRRPKRPCGSYHPKRQPWFGLTVDDVAELLPAEKIVPLRVGRGEVHLVDLETRALYQELTGESGDYSPAGSQGRGKPALTSTYCANPVHDQVLPEGPLCFKCGRNAVGSGGVLCTGCLTQLQNRPARSYYDLT